MPDEQTNTPDFSPRKSAELHEQFREVMESEYNATKHSPEGHVVQTSNGSPPPQAQPLHWLDFHNGLRLFTVRWMEGTLPLSQQATETEKYINSGGFYTVAAYRTEKFPLPSNESALYKKVRDAERSIHGIWHESLHWTTTERTLIIFYRPL